MITTKRLMTDNVLEPRDGPPLPPNGEVEGPRAGARSEPRVHTVFLHPRRHYRLSRPPPTIVRSHWRCSQKYPTSALKCVSVIQRRTKPKQPTLTASTS